MRWKKTTARKNRFRKQVATPHGSIRVGGLPKGCELCIRGEKLVLLTSGICGRKCWYCPLSEEKKGRDVIYANEWRVLKDSHIIREAVLSGAHGAGITGGDPLCTPERTLRLIRLLKKRFGKSFHIHLYTTGEVAKPNLMKRLFDAKVDEIRFHPGFLDSDTDLSPLEKALEYGWDVGCEIPVIPSKVAKTKAFLSKIDCLGVDFVNLNQLEFSQSNEETLMKMGFRPESEFSFAVSKTLDAAKKLLKHIREKTSMKAHYCTVHLKDGVQMKNRIKKRAANVALKTDIITEDGLLLRGAAYPLGGLPSFGHTKKSKRRGVDRRLAGMLYKKRVSIMKLSGLSSDEVTVDAKRGRILTYPEAAERFSQKIRDAGLSPAIVEEYPTWDGLITDLIVL